MTHIRFMVLSFGLMIGSLQAQEAQRPSILFIAVDDLRPSLGCYGDRIARTPHIDRLAARGIRFERAYCQYPVCNPSRASLLTGLRPDTTRIFENRTPLRSTLPEATTLPALFRRNGYFTARVGKIFHDGAAFDDDRAWDVALTPRGDPAFERGEGRSMAPYPWCRWVASDAPDDKHPDGQTAAEGIRLLEAERDRPFFIALGFRRPHDPFVAPKRFFDLYPLERLEPPKDPAGRSADVPGAIPDSYRFDFTDRDRREFMRAYYAGASFTDAQLGRVLDAVDRLKLWDRTIVVFFGDHGYHLGERGWWNKNTLFELSARVPLLVRAPGMKARRQSSGRLVELVDIYPTLAQLAGLAAPAGLEGTSFVPLLDDPARPWKQAAFTQVQRGRVRGRSVRTERWRYTEWDEGRAGRELYDQVRDPGEHRNLAGEPGHAATVRELSALLRTGRAAPPARAGGK